MTTHSPADVIIPATDAHELARITYRQLDHWARQGWVRPSVDSGQGRSGRRLYSPADVVRLDLLRHLAVSKVNAAVAGPAVAELEVPEGDVRIVWGPVANRDAEPELHVVPAAKALALLEAGGAHVVYNPAPLQARISRAALHADVAEPAAKVSA